MKALLVIDMQNDFLPGGSLPVAEGDRIISTINDLTPTYDLVVATQDWHPYNHESFVTQHPGNHTFETININDIPQTIWPEHCVQDSWGAQLSDQLSLKNVAVIFRKGMNVHIDSYSAFFDNARGEDTGLDSYLKGKGVTQIDVCGLAADFCVFFSAMDALSLGYEATILEKATMPIDIQQYEEKKKEFLQKGGKILY